LTNAMSKALFVGLGLCASKNSPASNPASKRIIRELLDIALIVTTRSTLTPDEIHAVVVYPPAGVV
jgi:hypothetical protein